MVALLLAAALALHTGTSASAQVASVVAGTGTRGYSGDGGPASDAQLDVPSAVFVDVDGNITIADTSNDRVRTISTTGTISTLAGTGERASTGDGSDATLASLGTPTALFVDGRGNTYIAEWTGHRVRKVSPTGSISTVVGTGAHGFSGDGAQAVQSSIWSPTAIFIDRANTLYIAEWGNNRIRAVSDDGIISTVAGTGIRGYTGDGGPATDARINTPNGLFVGDDGTVYFSDLGNQMIRRVLPDGRIERVAGTGNPNFTGDGGPATLAAIHNPSGLFVDSAGTLYFVDAGNARVRAVTADGIITTVAGGTSTEPAEPSGPLEVSLFGPTAVFVDTHGALYIAEGSRHRVRRLNGIAAPTDLPGAQPASSDFDDDGVVGFFDFLLFVEHFGSLKEDGRFDPRYDLLEDGSIGFADFLRFARAFGTAAGL